MKSKTTGLWIITAATAGLLMTVTGVASAEEDPLRLVVFGEHPPYHSQSEAGELKGFDVDLAEAIGTKLGRKVEIRMVTEERVIYEVVEDRADAVMGISETRDGAKIFDYSTPYLIHKTRVFIHESTSFIHRLADLRGLRVGVRRGFDVKEYLRIVPGIRLVLEPNAWEGLRNLTHRVTSVYMGDEYECEYMIQKEQLKGVTTFGGPILLRRRTVAVRKGNEELLSKINGALEELQREFTLQLLVGQWFSRKIGWSGGSRNYLYFLLLFLAIWVVTFLIILIWNQKLAEAVSDRTREVQSEHEHFQNMFDHASDGIVVLDPETSKVIEINKAFEEILQYDEGELKRFSLADLDATDEKNFGSQIHRAMVTGESILFETRMWNKLRQQVYLVIHARAFPFKGKRMVEAIARDVTERKKLEAMKDTILQDVAHELKTPMAKLSMSVQLLENKVPKEHAVEYARHFDVCHRAIIRLQNTIEGILNLSRLESHATRFHADFFIIQEVIQNVVQEMEMFADRKGVHLVREMEEGQLLIRGDFEMIRRLFVNLIHNAIKFTDKGAVTVSVASDERFVKVSVKDDGIGLAKEDLSKIFNRFYQKSAAYEGSGVGLTICQKIIAYHNGAIWAESEGLGKGVTMHALFPIHKPDEEKK